MIVHWHRPVSNRYGQLVYISTDGRFTITKRRFTMPSASVGYMLEGAGVRGAMMRTNDTLADAKSTAQLVVDLENGVVS